jgi:hypothetical protein
MGMVKVNMPVSVLVSVVAVSLGLTGVVMTTLAEMYATTNWTVPDNIFSRDSPVVINWNQMPSK